VSVNEFDTHRSRHDDDWPDGPNNPTTPKAQGPNHVRLTQGNGTRPTTAGPTSPGKQTKTPALVDPSVRRQQAPGQGSQATAHGSHGGWTMGYGSSMRLRAKLGIHG